MWFVALAVTFAVVVGSFQSSLTWGGPRALFWTITPAASLCAIAAAAVVWVGFRRRTGEVALAGATLWAASILPLVHGLTAPGVLYGPNSAVTISAFFALPLALLSGLPLVLPERSLSRRIARAWRPWTLAAMSFSTALAISLLVMPDRFPEPAAASGYAVAISAVCLFAFLAMSWRQLTLYWVGRHRSSIVASMGYLFLGATAMVWWQHSTFTIGWWLVHAVDVIGVTIGCFSVTRNSLLPADVEELLTPILQRDPLVALEFGLAPVVHQFVADLDTKDPITRDHVIRTSESAMRVGQALGLASSRLRHLGIAALLHDIGKLEVPDAVLNKPGRLDAAEFEIMQRHAASGADMLGLVPSLAPAAPFVRGHHERIDGNGYPDGLVGDQIPLEARIISVCDAFDAMSHTRQYRTGMGTEKAQAIMREHAGSQWDPDVVEVALRVLPELHGVAPALTNVGRDRRASETEQAPVVCACADALPELVDLHA